jgi:hypothetical protein
MAGGTSFAAATIGPSTRAIACGEKGSKVKFD